MGIIKMLEEIKYTTKFIGFTGAMFHFIVSINGQSFDYRMGAGHCTKLNNDKTSVQFKITELEKDDRISICKAIFGYHRSISIYEYENLKIVYVKRPDLKEVLNCLFLDSMARDQCFEDWCDDFGYSMDSISQKKIYDDCIQNSIRLKKALGNKYHDIKQYIEGLEL